MTKPKTWLVLLLAGLAVTGVVLAADEPSTDGGTQKPSSLAQSKADDTSEQEKPAVPKQVHVDRYGDPLPPGAIARLGTVRFRASAEPDALAFSPDGKTIAVSARGGLYLYAADSGQRIKRLAESGRLLAFSPDSKRLSAGGYRGVDDDGERRPTENVIRVWQLADELKPREYHAERVIWLGWSADGQPLAICLEKDAILLRELASGRSQRFECPNLLQERYTLCDYAPSGKSLAIADDQNTIHVWDTATGAKRCTVPPLQDVPYARLAVSSDGRHLATMPAILTPPYVHAVQIWDTRTGQALRSVTADHKLMSTLAFAPNGKTLVTAGSNGIRYWDVATGREQSRSERKEANTWQVAFSTDSQTLATLNRYTSAFHIWDVATGKLRAEPQGHMSRPHRTSFSPDGRRLASAASSELHIWDLATNESLFTVQRPGDWVRRAEFSRDGRSLFTTCSDEIWIADAANGKPQHVIKLEDHERPKSHLSATDTHLSADGKTLVSFALNFREGDYDTLITGWDLATRKQLFQRRLPSRGWEAVSADTRLLALSHASSGRGPMQLQSLATGELLLNFRQLEGQTWPVEFSPDGRLLASVNSNFQRRKKGDPSSTGTNFVLWELATAAEVLSLPAAGQHRAAFSPNGRLLAVTAPLQEILVWDLAQGRELRRFKGFDAEVRWLAFAPDGRRLVSGLFDSTLLIWDVGAPLQTDKPGAEALAKAWDDLAGSDAPRAFQARWALVSAPDATLALFQKQLKPAQPADAGRLQKLIADLESPQFSIRNTTNKELEELGDLATGALRQALMKNPSLELRRRAQALLDKLRGPITRRELLRSVRAVAVLEDIANPTAQKFLETLAQGAPEARLTQEAQGALHRLGTR